MKFLLSVSVCFNLLLFCNSYALDFDTSLGKNDPYYGKYYADLVESLNKIDLNFPSWGFCFKGQPPVDFFNFCRALYEKNNLSKIKPDEQPRIPLVIHQIWLGGPFPEKYKSWQKTWKSLKKLGFKYKLWTEKELAKLPMINRDIYNQSENLGEKSDIARIEILNLYGGIYADTDYESLNPKIFLILNKCYDFYCGLTQLDEHILYAPNAFIAAAKGHPLLRAYINGLAENWKNEKNNFVSVKTGPAYFTGLFMAHLDKCTRDIVFPPTVLYPLGYEHSKELFQEGLNRKEIKARIVKPESIAIHWWEGSWKKPAAKVS